MSEPHDVKYERRDIVARPIVKFAGITIVLAVLMHLGLQGFMSFLTYLDGRGERPIDATIHRPPEPRLQVDEANDLAAIRREEALRLNNYGWIDRKEKRVHIPIDQAMETIVQKGLPDLTDKKEKAVEPEKKQPDKPEAPK